SSLARVLARLAEPGGGQVRFGGVDLRDASRTEVRQRITFVAQRPMVLSGTIEDNLRLGRPALTLPELRAACRIAALDEHIDTLPDGYRTEVGEGGSTLSGGQLQRLALAR